MTDEEKASTIQEYFAGFPEAPASDTFKWTDGAGFEHMTTIRQWSGSTLYEQVAKMVARVLETGGKPAGFAPPPVNTIPVRDENGTPVVDGNTGQPVMTDLPEGVHLYTVAGLVHDKNKDGTKDILKVFTVEQPYHKGYGVSCFHPPAELKGFIAWAVTSKDNKAMYAPPETCKHVLIRDPKADSKYADVVDFRP